MEDINIVGGFPGDDELWQEVLWCRDNLATLASNEHHFSRLLQLCDRLPSLPSFAVKVLSHASNSSLIERLMEECLMEDDTVDSDTDFVLLANEETRTLNTDRFNLFAVILTLLGIVPPNTAIRVARTYLRSSSTRFRSAVLAKLAAIPQFTDAQLYQAFEKAPEGTRSAILQACCAAKHRQGFFELLNDPAYIFYCSSDCVRQSLPDLFVQKRTLAGWREHRAVFLEFFQQALVKCQGNVLKQGIVWNTLCSMLPGSMEEADVFAVWKFLEDFRPCFLEATLPPHVTAHLEALADQMSSESIMCYEGVRPYRKIWEQIQLLSSTKSRFDLLQSAIVNGDWELFQTFPKQQLQLIIKQKQTFRPVEYILNQTTADDLWSHIETKPSNNKFFLSCVQTDNLLEWLVGKYCLSIDAFWKFSDLHLRSPPKEREDWSRWFNSYHCLTWKEHMSAVQTKIVNAALCVRPIARSRITLYARFVKEMLDLTYRTIETASQSFVVEESVSILATLRHYYDVLYSHYYGFLNPPPVVVDLLKSMDKVLLQIVLPRLVALLCFDPSDEKRYIVKDNLSMIASWLQSVYKAKPPQEILEACLDSAKNIMTNAQANRGDELLPNGRDRFCEISSNNGKRQFVLYDTCLHRIAVKQCLGHIDAIVKVSNDKRLQERVIIILKSHNYFRDNLQGYLEFCKHLNPELLANERTAIIRLSQIYLARTATQSGLSIVGSSLARIGLLEEVLKDNILPEALQNAYILAYAGFGNAVFRDSLKVSTQVRDSQDRANAHVAWLQAAFDSNLLDHMQESFLYTATRVKNEGGNVRSVIYHWLRCNISQIVVRCLQQEATGPSLIIKSELSGLCRSDLDRRDSCGKGSFADMSRAIISAALDFDNKKQILGLRQIWVSCAVELHWNVQQLNVGDQGMPYYNWPINAGFQLPSSSWISWTSFDAVYPLPKNAESIGNLTARINLLQAVQNGNMSSYFGPNEAVELLVTTLKELWKAEYPCSLFGLSDGVLAKPTMERLLLLFRLCGIGWQESPFLTSSFSEIFSSGLGTSTKEEHLESASTLLRAIIGIHGEFFHEISRVKNACELFFASIVSTWRRSESQKTLAKTWLSVLLLMKNKEKIHNWNLDDFADPRLLPFLSRHCAKCEPLSCVVSKVPAVTRMSETASYILHITKSAFWTADVRQLLFAVRPDVFSSFLDLDDPLDGPFVVSSTEISQSRISLVDLTLLERLSPKVAKAYTNRCREIIIDGALSVLTRAKAIENLMDAPSTSHRDVLKLLGLNLDESLLEALILKIFSIDSPWHLLASMFTTESIERMPQRMMATILGHIQKHVHVDTVVKALGFLIEEPRRKSVKVQLHKAIVRLLFEAGTALATEFLSDEWDRASLHKDVRYLIVERCVAAILTKKQGKSIDWESNVLSAVAKDTSRDAETAVLLFTPLRKNRIKNDLSQLMVMYFDQHCKDETLRLFLDKWPSRMIVSDDSSVRFFGSIYLQLEESTSNSVIQMLAKCQRFAFSDLFASKPSDHQGVLSEIRLYLSNIQDVPCQWDDLTRLVVEFATDVFLDGSLACLIESILAQQADKTGKVHDTVWNEISGKDIVVGCVRELVRLLLESLVNLPMVNTTARRKIQTALGRVSCRLPGRKNPPFVLELFGPIYGRDFVVSIEHNYRLLLEDIWKPYLELLKSEKIYTDRLFT